MDRKLYVVRREGLAEAVIVLCDECIDQDVLGDGWYQDGAAYDEPLKCFSTLPGFCQLCGRITAGSASADGKWLKALHDAGLARLPGKEG